MTGYNFFVWLIDYCYRFHQIMSERISTFQNEKSAENIRDRRCCLNLMFTERLK